MTGKCSVCGNKAYTELQGGKMVSGEKNGVWYCRTHFPQDDPDKKPNPDNEKKWGKDFGQLKPGQREGRVKTSNNWDEKRKKSYARNKVCRYCPQIFPYDTSLEFLPAKEKAETELTTHEASCPKKNDRKEQQRLKQEKWEQWRNKKGSPFYTCQKCWGKVCLDKKIESWIEAKKQALADLNYHEKRECGTDKKTIPILFSPNQGGNQHAPLNYADGVNENNLVMDRDNETEVIYSDYQEQANNKSVLPWIIGGGIGIIAIIGFTLLLVRPKKRKRKKY